MLKLLVFLIFFSLSYSALAKQGNDETAVGVAQPNGGDYESSKVAILFVNHRSILHTWSDNANLGMATRFGFGGFSD